MGRSLRGARRAQLYCACLRSLLDAAQAGTVNQATTEIETLIDGTDSEDALKALFGRAIDAQVEHDLL